jgi:hypothetical protein
MPTGPKGQKRPADVIGNAAEVMRIATGEEEKDYGKSPKRAKGGRKGGKARAASLTPQQRSEFASAAADLGGDLVAVAGFEDAPAPAMASLIATHSTSA